MSAAHVYLHRDGLRKPVYARIDLQDVRAANTIIIHYDFDRDGWVVESPTKMVWLDGEDSLDERLEEVAFVPAWSAKAAAEVDGLNGLRPTDLTTETSSERGRRDALRHEVGLD